MIESSSHLHGMVLKTRDADEAAALLGSAAVPYRSQPLSGSPPFSTEILVLKGRSIVLSTASTTGKLLVRTVMSDDSFGIVLDLGKGIGPHQENGTTVEVGPDFSFIQNPSTQAEIVTEEKYRVLFLRVGVDELTRELERRLMREVKSKLVFQSRVNMRTSAGQKLRTLSEGVRRTLCSTNRKDIQTSPAIANLEAGIMNLLLEAQPHNYARLMHRYTSAGTWQVTVAAEYMKSCAHLPVSLGDVCSAAGVNARTLQYSFHRQYGCSPMAFLQKIKLGNVRADLMNPDEGATVSNLAAKWGFFHFGRFSGAYFRVFGERPSETLRRARKRIQ